MFPNDRVAEMVTQNFLPVTVHVREQAADFQRLGSQFGAEWTPTILLLDGQGRERHRIEGFLPAGDFLGQLEFARGRIAFSAGDFEEAERLFRHVVSHHGESDAAAESQYWAGVARYKATNDPEALAETARAFRDSYQDSTWAKKASVWGK